MKPNASTSAAELARSRLRENAEMMAALLNNRESIALLVEVAATMAAALLKGNKVLLFGNGGSAADAQHLAAELVGKYYLQRRALPALALTTNSSAVTAIGNDYSFDEVFARQIEAFGAPGDVAVGISTSGNSQNVLRALVAARSMGLVTVGLTGRGGGQLANLVDFCLRVPSDDTPRIQEGHITIGHIICEIVEDRASTTYGA